MKHSSNRSRGGMPMGCRMLIGIGMLPIKELLDGFLLMAQNRNEEHEYSSRDKFNHGDGWGYVVRRKGELKSYRQVAPCWEDPEYLSLYHTSFDLILLHARKASPMLPVDLDSTHPFQMDGWYFCHNGTIYDPDFRNGSDSKKLFYKILESIALLGDVVEAIRKTVGEVKNYTALNFILLGGGKAYVLNHYSPEEQHKHPKYYTMKYLETDDYIIVSSEQLKSLGEGWKRIENQTLIQIDTQTLTLKYISPKSHYGKAQR